MPPQDCKTSAGPLCATTLLRSWVAAHGGLGKSDVFSSRGTKSQRRRDDNKIKFFALEEGGGLGGREENRPKTLVFEGNATTIRFRKVQI